MLPVLSCGLSLSGLFLLELGLSSACRVVKGINSLMQTCAIAAFLF